MTRNSAFIIHAVVVGFIAFATTSNWKSPHTIFASAATSNVGAGILLHDVQQRIAVR
jgi:hypothetical protein